MSAMSQRSTKRFSDAEQAAMRERAEEQKAAAGRGAGAKVDGESDALTISRPTTSRGSSR
jgi:hypothetical protein